MEGSGYGESVRPVQHGQGTYNEKKREAHDVCTELDLGSMLGGAGSVVSVVVLVSRRCGVNPDNVATPIAGSLGDLTTILLLAGIATTLHAPLHGRTEENKR